MANNNKVTIDAAFFYELFRKANETDTICKECREEHTAEEFNALRKERDELKEKIDGDATANGLSPATIKLLEKEKRLAEAERCIEQVFSRLSWMQENEIIINEISEVIRAYREKKEAAR